MHEHSAHGAREPAVAGLFPGGRAALKAELEALLAARARGLAPVRLGLRASADTAGPMERVVGYGAWSFAAPAT